MRIWQKIWGQVGCLKIGWLEGFVSFVELSTIGVVDKYLMLANLPILAYSKNLLGQSLMIFDKFFYASFSDRYLSSFQAFSCLGKKTPSLF